ncbi:vacuolar protein sorting-associated protein VTA1 homolog [Neocloeon triangulifer]|uniref:vacuolar protein sorting-associated protein VTA1 homolog n=1 Tax=Neocloeon triangulifer TaxID=2078957 RepID=UPI00286EC47A|nr:vacuolar protein sorting-associated protein VTA1 homolog [Neocloeon triangulifer]
MSEFPPCPPQFKPLQHYLKIAAEHDQRDPIISYWCRVYALQMGLKIDKKSPEALKLLMSLMDWLEKKKKEHADNDSITNEIAAQAYMENHALKIFMWADGQDRAGIFNKNVVKSFYTAGMLFDVMETYGELTESVAQSRKYAKWKASYIHNCLKNGEMPIPGPQGELEDEEGAAGGAEFPGQPTMGFVQPPGAYAPDPTNNLNPGVSGHSGGHPDNYSNFNLPAVPPSGFDPQDLPSVPGMNFPSVPPSNYPSSPSYPTPTPQVPQQPAAPSSAISASGASLNPDQITKAQKYCKWAASALNYDDIPTAISNLEKGLVLLKTGQDPN